MDAVERRYISQVLIALKGNKASAARLLGLGRRTLYRKLARWNLGAMAAVIDVGSGPKGTDRSREEAELEAAEPAWAQA